MSNKSLHFIGWDEPAIELIAKELFELREKDPISFCRSTVVVPTAESGRRLCEYMAEQADEQAILMPRMVQTPQLIPAAADHVANDMEILSVWVHVLQRVNPHEEWPALFPRLAHATQKNNWILGAASGLMRLRGDLIQYEVDMNMVSRKLDEFGGCFFEAPETRTAMSDAERESWLRVADNEKERWAALQDIFERVDAELDSRGLISADAARAAEAANPVHFRRGGKLIIACQPDLTPQVRHYLSRRKELEKDSVLVLINAPDEKEWKKFFDTDDWGQLRVENWASATFDEKELPEARIHVSSTAQRMARTAVQLSAGLKQDEVTIASCDASFTPEIVIAFRRSGWQMNLPEGRAFSGTEISSLIRMLARAIEERDNMAFIEPLLRNTAMMRCFAPQKDFTEFGFLSLLDKTMSRYYPSHVSFLQRLLDPTIPLPELRQSSETLPNSPEMQEAQGHGEIETRILNAQRNFASLFYLNNVQEFLSRCNTTPGKALRDLRQRLTKAYADSPQKYAVEHLCRRMPELIDLIEKQSWALSEALPLFCQLLQTDSTTLAETPHEDTHLDVVGWRELAFCQGQRLVLTGIHDGCVPEPVVADSFLPDSLRSLLGMPCARSREARDAFLLKALLHRKGTEVHLLLSRSAADGTGNLIAPSPLLLHCHDDLLVKRVSDTLYREMCPEEVVDEYSRQWSLAPKDAPMTATAGMESVPDILPDWVNKFNIETSSFSPSRLNNFLSCPLRFWMKEALGISPWNEYQENKVAMEANEFGLLMHSVLEDVARRYPNANELTTEEDVANYALKRLRQRAAERYGEITRPTTRLQLDNMEKPLRAFTKWHCDELKNGWSCYDCEHKVEKWSFPLTDGRTALLSTTIDRIDHHEDGRWRIIDYKTHDHTPGKEHLEKITDTHRFEQLMPDFPLPSITIKKGGKTITEYYRWKNIQLPLYAYQLMEAMHCEQPEMGYFNLPRSGKVTKCTYHPMGEMQMLSPSAMESALTWARKAIEYILDGKCLYSAESLGCEAYGSYSFNDDEHKTTDPRTLFPNLRNLND